MKKIIALLTAVLLAGTIAKAQEDRLTSYVNPFIGTAGFGNVYPGAQLPYGGIQISPDTDDYDYDVAAGYKYTKPNLLGFSLTHLSGTGIPDLGDFLFVPGEDAEAPLNHALETASPGYYSADFNGVKTELTAALRSGIHAVPFYLLDEKYSIPGALSYDDFKKVLAQIIAENEVDENTEADNCENGVCKL